MNIVKTVNLTKTYNSGVEVHALSNVNFEMEKGDLVAIIGDSGSGDSDIMMTDTINSFKSKFKGFHKTFKQDDLGLSLSFFY